MTRISVPRDLQIENLKREVETLRAELEKIKMEVRGMARGGPHTAGPRVVPTWMGQGSILPFLPCRPRGTSHSLRAR